MWGSLLAGGELEEWAPVQVGFSSKVVGLGASVPDFWLCTLQFSAPGVCRLLFPQLQLVMVLNNAARKAARMAKSDGCIVATLHPTVYMMYGILIKIRV